MRVLLASPHYPPAHVGGVEYYTRRLATWLAAEGAEPEVICVEQVVTGKESEVHADVDHLHRYPVHRLRLSMKQGPYAFRLHWHDPALESWISSQLSRMRPDVVHLQSGYLLGGSLLAAARAQHVPTVVTLHDLWFICPRITMMHPDTSRCSGPDDSAKCSWCLKTERRRFSLADKWSGGALGRAARLAMRTLQGPEAQAGRSLSKKVAGRQRGLLAALADAQAILSPTRFVRDQLEKAGFEPGRIQIVPYGVAASRPATRPRQSRSAPLRIGYLGQLAPHKGIHVLVAAARSLPSTAVELSLWGPDEPHVGYVQMLRRLAGNDGKIRFAGAYNNEQVDDLLATLDAIVVPSVWHENYPFVVLEALRAGVPVVGSRVGGIPEMIQNEVNGLLFEPGNSVELARCLRRLADEAPLLPRLRDGIQPVRSDRDEQSELLGIYARVAASSSGAPVG